MLCSIDCSAIPGKDEQRNSERIESRGASALAVVAPKSLTRRTACRLQLSEDGADLVGVQRFSPRLQRPPQIRSGNRGFPSLFTLGMTVILIFFIGCCGLLCPLSCQNALPTALPLILT